MTVIVDAAVKAEPIDQEIRNYIDANMYSLQKARLDKRKNATPEDLFKNRNPYYLRSTRKSAWELVKCSLDNYLLSVDELLFADFARELSVFMARRGQRMLSPAAILELFAQDDLPLRTELLEEHDRVFNRLLYQFYEELCDEDSRVDWERLTRFIYECDAASQTE